MKYRVVRKQQNSRLCFVCGLKNEYGLKTAFYELENGQLAAVFTTAEEHQSYPGRLHGGVAAAVLDETIGRAVMMGDDDCWGVTIDLQVSYKKPLPLGEALMVVGRITKDSSRIFEGTGEVYLKNGEIAVTAHGKYLKMPIEKIADFNEGHEEWKVVPAERDPVEIELPF